MEKTTGPSAVAHLGNPVAHPSVAEGGAACAVRGVLGEKKLYLTDTFLDQGSRYSDICKSKHILRFESV